MLRDEYTIIKCPVCGQEYLPSEIFYPNDFIGKPTEIIKDTSGRIEFYLGDDPSFDENFICDNCNTRLKIHASVHYKVDVDSTAFNEEYVSTFEKQDKLTLEESSVERWEKENETD